MDRLTILFVALAVLILAISLHPTGFSQEQRNTATNRGVTNRGLIETAPRGPQDFSKNTWNLPPDADKTKNPVEATEESITKGKELYLARKGNCIFCHGETGAGNEETLPRLRRKPADLSNKERMTTLSDGEIFWKVTLGIEGIMPGREKALTEEERWHVVNYVRTLAKEK
ncbi:MAG TPA: cytochrome c [Pyrinomonadaceae bacterium]|jgi:mono/diheme cytochrome c family protein